MMQLCGPPCMWIRFYTRPRFCRFRYMACYRAYFQHVHYFMFRCGAVLAGGDRDQTKLVNGMAGGGIEHP